VTKIERNADIGLITSPSNLTEEKLRLKDTVLAFVGTAAAARLVDKGEKRMKSRIVIPIAMLMLLWGATAGFGASNQAPEEASSIAADPAQDAPVAVIPELKHEFDPVVDGAEVVQDFTVRNTGKGTLAIHQVKTG
jgi:hypothetical protein